MTKLKLGLFPLKSHPWWIYPIISFRLLSFQGKVTKSGKGLRLCNRCRNAVNNEIKQAKEQYYRKVLHENDGDSHKTWRIINELTSKNVQSSSVKETKLNNNSICDPHELSSAFNDHFSTIGVKLINDIQHCGNNLPHLEYLKETEHRFELKTNDCPKVFSLLSKLCKFKATGLDKISALLLCECADLISSSLCCIFHRSISSGFFSDEWKCSKDIPPFKQGENSI